MYKLPYKIILLVVGTLMMASCGGGKDSPPPASKLQGSWYGEYVGPGEYLHSLSLDVDAAGNISNVKVDGVATGDTGTTAQTGENTFSYTLNDGTKGGFMADSAGNHVGMLDEDLSYGILQKGASGFPTYAGSDIGGQWSGYTVELNSDFSVFRTYTSSANINSSTLNFIGSTPDGSFSGSLPKFKSTYGYWVGTWRSSQSLGYVLAWMSPDKTFAASWACDSGYSSQFTINDASGCSFSMWNK